MYVDRDDAELADYPTLAEAVADDSPLPLVLVGDEISSPSSIGVYWIEEQLARLDSVGAGAVAGGDE